MFHRPWLTSNPAPATADVLAGLVDVFDFQRDMAVALAQIVLVDAPVVSQFQHAVMRLVAVTDERQGEFAFRVVFTA